MKFAWRHSKRNAGMPSGPANSNAQRDAAATQKAIAAQIAQMVQKNRQSKGAGDIAYNFTHGNKIERLYVSAAVQAHLIAGRLVIVCLGGTAELVPGSSPTRSPNATNRSSYA